MAKPGISIAVRGVRQVQLFLTAKDKQALLLASQAITQAGFFIEGEVKQSIAGHRAEPRSVDTGRFLNSVNMNKPTPLSAVVSTPLEYPKILEFGGKNRNPRRHFGNTARRNQVKVQAFIQNKLKKL